MPHTAHAFSQSPSSAHVVYGSVGRSAFADTLSLSPSRNIRSPEYAPLLSSGANFDDDVLENADARFVVTPQQARRLAEQERDLLDSFNSSYGSTESSSQATLTADQVEEEVAAINKVWDEAVEQGKVSTTFGQELRFIVKSSLPLIVTFLLQYSLTVASIFSVGHLGKSELAAVSLGSMTAAITGFALIQGLATCLDTLCAQAYGAGNHTLVGDYCQKSILMIITCFIPVGTFWVYSEPILRLLVSDEDPNVPIMAAQYLKTVLFGVPGYIAFECGKRFVQAQGIFHASTLVLIICAPLNALLNYILVWNPVIGIGFRGAPAAVAFSQWFMATLLFCYVIFIDGRKCWGGFSRSVFTNWGVMFKLAIPGVIMIEAEFFAFEILTFAAAQLGTTALAAQSVIATISSLAYQIPFALSIASSTRIANFIGAGLSSPAKVTKHASLFCGAIIGVFNAIFLYSVRYKAGSIFSNDEDVIQLVGDSIYALTLAVFVDAPGSVLGGILRGMGRQSIGGYLNLIAYYVLATPLGIFLTFKCGMGLGGLWLGITLGLTVVDIAEFWYVERADWDSIIDEAQKRQQVERIVEP